MDFILYVSSVLRTLPGTWDFSKVCGMNQEVNGKGSNKGFIYEGPCPSGAFWLKMHLEANGPCQSELFFKLVDSTIQYQTSV